MLPLTIDNQGAAVLAYLVGKVLNSLHRVKHVYKFTYDGKTEQILLSCGKEVLSRTSWPRQATIVVYV